MFCNLAWTITGIRYVQCSLCARSRKNINQITYSYIDLILLLIFTSIPISLILLLVLDGFNNIERSSSEYFLYSIWGWLIIISFTVYKICKLPYAFGQYLRNKKLSPATAPKDD